MLKRILIVLVLNYVLLISGYGQNEKTHVRNHEFIAFVGGEMMYNIQEMFFLNISIGGHYFSHKGNFFSAFYPDYSGSLQLGSDIGYKAGTLYFAPRASLQGQIHQVALRTSISCLLDGTNRDWRFSPEIGFTAYNAFYIFYGYDFNLDRKDIGIVPNHKITLGIRLIPLLHID